MTCGDSTEQIGRGWVEAKELVILATMVQKEFPLVLMYRVEDVLEHMHRIN